MEEEPVISDLNNAVCEMNLLYGTSHSFSSASPITTAANESTSSSRYSHSHATTLNIRPIFTTTKVQMNLNPRYISKISNSTRTALRMRPYFIPAERSRTKSENAVEPSVTLPNHLASLYSADIDAESAIEQVTNVGPNAATSAMDCDGAFEMNGNATIVVPTVSGVLPKTGGKLNDEPSVLKKSKSLDDIYSVSARRVRNVVDASQPSHEMEFVSSRIQKLKVHD